MTKPIKRKWGGYGGECGGVWRSVEERGVTMCRWNVLLSNEGHDALFEQANEIKLCGFVCNTKNPLYLCPEIWD